MKTMIRLAVLLLVGTQSLMYSYEANSTMTPDASLQRLIQGNQRFVSDKLEHPDRTLDRREVTVAKQRPFAIILGCADSRIPPEIVFDLGIGDLFVVRVAGNIVGPLEMESIEYSVLVNDSSIVMVLGHENCGAVSAVLANNTKGIPAIAKLIEPAVQQAKNQKGDLLQNAIKDNVLAVVKQLQGSEVLAKATKEGKLKVVGAYYNLKSGQVELL